MTVLNKTSSYHIGLMELILLYTKHLKYVVEKVGVGNYTFFNTRVTPRVIDTIKKRIDQLRVMYQEPTHLKEANKLNGKIEGAIN